MSSIMSTDIDIGVYHPRTMSDEVQLTFGEWLADLLFQHDLTQAEFAERIDVSQSTVSAWLSGAHPPRRNSVYKVADFFGVPRTEAIKHSGLTPSVRDTYQPVTVNRRIIYGSASLTEDSALSATGEVAPNADDEALVYMKLGELEQLRGLTTFQRGIIAEMREEIARRRRERGG